MQEGDVRSVSRRRSLHRQICFRGCEANLEVEKLLIMFKELDEDGSGKHMTRCEYVHFCAVAVLLHACPVARSGTLNFQEFTDVLDDPSSEKCAAIIVFVCIPVVISGESCSSILQFQCLLGRFMRRLKALDMELSDLPDVSHETLRRDYTQSWLRAGNC